MGYYSDDNDYTRFAKLLRYPIGFNVEGITFAVFYGYSGKEGFIDDTLSGSF